MTLQAPSPGRAVVIGGGISGLACAYGLREAGIPVLLLEQSQRLGGMIDSVEQDGFLFELGPQSFLSTETLLEVIAGLGLDNELLRADPRAPRFILRRGRLELVPRAPPALLSTGLLSFGTKWRLLSEPFRRTQPPKDDESVADFVRRKFGAELLELLLAPFVSGVYAGDPEKLSLRSAFPSVHQWEQQYGSVIRGAMKSRPAKDKPPATLCTFRKGMVSLPRALGERLGDEVRCSVSVTSIRRGKANGNSEFELTVSHHGHEERITSGAVIVATETQPAGRLLAGISPDFASHLARVEYAPVAVVATGYRREQVSHPVNGFGFLVPRTQKLRILGTVWTSSLFPGRAPEGLVSFTSFAGGATDPDLLRLNDAEIVEVVARELAGVLRITGAPAAWRVQRYERALPQYNLGHGRTLAALRALTANLPGLFLTGNYLEGPAIGVCVEQALRTAQVVRQYVEARREAATCQESRPLALPSAG